MVGMDQFLNWFGNITITQIVGLGLAGFFIYKMIKKINTYLQSKWQLEQQKDEELKTAIKSMKTFDSYHNEIATTVNNFQTQLNDLKANVQNTNECLLQLKNDMDKRARNDLREKLLKEYRYYTDHDKNPTQSWKHMESEAFWALFKDYEDAGGDGFVHTIVQPAMNLLSIIDD